MAVLEGCGKSRPPTGIRSTVRPTRRESVYRLIYPGPRGQPYICRRKFMVYGYMPVYL